MKQFDSASIASRTLASLSTSSNWSQLLGDSATTELISSFADSEAESVRYMENLLSEAKWGYAQNLSSFVTQASYLGYIPQRRVSAIGTIYISHDPQMANLGATLFTLSDLQSNLTTYGGSTIPIAVGTVFSTTTSPQIKFLSTQAVAYASGMQYLAIPVIQGVVSSVVTTMLGNPFEEIQITDNTIEDASNSISSQFFYVNITPAGTSTSVLWNKLEDIYLADSTDTSYDIKVPTDLSSTIVRFGNGIVGMIVPAQSTASVTYISSLGIDGNINSNYSVNTILTPLPISMYCSNLSPILGGASIDTPLNIQGKAPTAYVINGGSIISAPGYKALIESFSYVKTASVYAALYLNPLSGLTQNTIMYSAINTEGADANYDVYSGTSGLLVSAVETALLNKNSPLDVIQYISPNFLHVKFNIIAQALSLSSISLSSLESTIQEDIYSNFGTLTQSFNSVYDNSALLSYINKNYSLQQISPQLEAVTNLLPSNFTIDNAHSGSYLSNFYFDPSFNSLYGFDNNHQYCLKINIIFTCASCLSNSRTLFLVPISSTAIAYTCTINSSAMIVGIGNSYTTFTFNSTVFSPGSSPSFTIPVSPVPTVASVMKAIWTTLNASSYNTSYSFILGSNNVLYVTPLSTTVGSSSISLSLTTGLQGITFNTVNSGNWQVLQYPYISVVTDNNYMLNYVLNNNTAPYVIPSTNTSLVVGSNIETLYIPFAITFDYSTLNPSNLSSTQLGSGSISIPTLLPGGSANSYYLNFSSSTANENVVIEVIAMPISGNIVPYAENNIVQLGQITQNGITVDDVIIQLQ
jgi:hypothetical protein